MGSLGYVVGGALAGAGKGIAEVGAEQLKQLHDEGIENLRAKHQQELQAQGQTRQEEFAREQSNVQFLRGQDVAGATRQFQTEQAQREQASRERIGKGHDISRENVANIRAAATDRAAGAKPVPSPMRHQGDYEYTDPKTNAVTKVPIWQHTASGTPFVAAGGVYVPFDSAQGLPKPGSVARPPSQATVALMKEPTQERMDAYLAAYHQLPMGFPEAQQRYYGSNPQAPGQGPLGKHAPPGAQWKPADQVDQDEASVRGVKGGSTTMPGAGSANTAEDEADDARADAEDEAEESQGLGGSRMPFSPTSQGGSSNPDDNVPAQ